MELELKHIAGYLPYGLKILENNEDIQIELIGIYSFKDVYTDAGDIRFESLKPILRPLEDLTKEIEVNGENFVPIENLGYNKNWSGLKSHFENIDYLPYRDIQKLLEWHFDIYGLIENNLAIDIKTL